jgi:hypothetical protein
MKRNFLAAAVASAPLLAAMAGAGHAQVQITGGTTAPVRTSTALGGQPANVVITLSGSITPTLPVTALTLDSNNSVENDGLISFTDISGATGIRVNGGNTGSVLVPGQITVTETYTATVNSNTGLADGAFALGNNRIGIDVEGAAPFVGPITDSGSVIIRGNDSEGILVNAPITGNLRMFTLAGSGATETIASGSIDMLGDRTVGLFVTPTGGVGGDLRITRVNALGIGAKAVEIDGNVGGTVNIAGAVTATGYRSAVRPTNPAVAVLYTASQLSQGGPAVSIGGNLGGGLIISAPPPVLSATISDQDGDGVPDNLQGTGIVSSFGRAPALQVGAVGQAVSLGLVGTGDTAYGLIIQGNVTGDGIYDPFLTPNLPSLVPATAVLLGVSGGGAVNIAGGIRNDGTILGQSYQADANALHLGSLVTAPTILNTGSIRASSVQINNAPGLVPVFVTAIEIDSGSSVQSIENSAGITANVTGAGGVGGFATAILDKSGSVTRIDNTGTITAQLTQTLTSDIMPGTTTAIDISAGTTPQTITQSVPAAIAGSTPYTGANTYAAGAIVTYLGSIYQATTAIAVALDPVDNPNLWRQIGAVVPTISGSIFFGSGGSNLIVTSGLIVGSVIDLGAGTNTVTVNGDPTTVVQAQIKDEGGRLTFNVINGRLSDTDANTVGALGVNVAATGVLLVGADPAHGTNLKFVTTGSSTFATGAQIGLTLESIQSAATQTYTILQTVPGQGTLTVGTFATGLLNDAPFLYDATPSAVLAADPATESSEILLTVTRKNQAQLGFNNAEFTALDPTLAAIPRDASIQATILNQTTQTGLKLTYDQLLPDQGQGLFDAIDAAARAVDSMIETAPDPSTRVAGTSLWLQEVNERVQRTGIETQGSASKLIGLVGGYERMGLGGGSIGATLAYFNTQETNTNSAVGQNVTSSMVELGAYYRREAGGLVISARGAGGYSWFTGERRFLSFQAANNAFSSWSGGFVDAHAGVSYQRRFGRFYGGPALAVDYIGLKESARSDYGGGTGFDLNVAPRTSTRLTGDAVMVFGAQWGRADWLRSELRVGYREIFAGSVGDTVANFAGDAPFTLLPDPSGGGWATVGFSLKGGSQFSYLAVEGDMDFRSGEQRYDLRLAGRSMF